MRGRSYSRSPPRRGYGRRRHSPSPRGRYRGYERDAPTSLLVRNLRLDCRPDDLRRPFSDFGPLKDVYLPRDYYNGEPRGFGFVQFVDPADAADAKHQMDGERFQGRELTVVFAEENRKKPVEMRARERTRSRSHDRRRSSAQNFFVHDLHPDDMQDLGLVGESITLGLFHLMTRRAVEKGLTLQKDEKDHTPILHHLTTQEAEAVAQVVAKAKA